MNPTLKPFVLCALNTGESIDYELAYLRDYGFSVKPLHGIYKRKVENSYLIIIEDSVDLKRLERVLIGRNQESYLYVDENRYGKLVSLEGAMESTPLGKFTEVSEEFALAQESCTVDYSEVKAPTDKPKYYWCGTYIY